MLSKPKKCFELMPVVTDMSYKIFCSQMQTCLGCVLGWLDSGCFQDCRLCNCTAGVSELINPVSQQAFLAKCDAWLTWLQDFGTGDSLHLSLLGKLFT